MIAQPLNEDVSGQGLEDGGETGLRNSLAEILLERMREDRDFRQWFIREFGQEELESQAIVDYLRTTNLESSEGIDQQAETEGNSLENLEVDERNQGNENILTRGHQECVHSDLPIPSK